MAPTRSSKHSCLGSARCWSETTPSAETAHTAAPTMKGNPSAAAGPDVKVVLTHHITDDPTDPTSPTSTTCTPPSGQPATPLATSTSTSSAPTPRGSASRTACWTRSWCPFRRWHSPSWLPTRRRRTSYAASQLPCLPHAVELVAEVWSAVGPSDQSVGRRAWFTLRMTAQASATGPRCPSLSGLITARIVWIRPSSMSSAKVLRTLPSR